ncbi:hypothetical protein [Mesorhizobium sp. ANAO-SY3R2]|uniref:hypothetical protein n=1 Tax=Mesorhizobium sp. ANAO-SY3R2 TaxID=3166644 RepID=UPI0036712B2E
MSYRYYLFPDEGDPLRISQRLLEGLVAGRDAIPHYADTRQRVLSARLELEAGKPVRILETQASIWVFDDEGHIRDGLLQALVLAMDTLPTPPKDEKTVVELRPRTSKRKLEEEFRWEPGQSEIDRVIADIWPKQKADRLKSIQGELKKKPPLTSDARWAIEQISTDFWKFANLISTLKEPSQKSFGFEARERAQEELEYAHLYNALAAMSDWQLEVQRRRRTGRGVWYAVVEVMLHRQDIKAYETAERFYERCSSRDEAVLAVRRLLVEHASKFTDYTTVEGELLTDLEWEQRAYPD